jgi:hypothetical protein
VLQLLVAGAMIGMHLPPVLRSLHEATGVSVWIATFALAYLARIAGDGHGVREPLVAPSPIDHSDSGVVRASTNARSASSTAIAEPRRKGVAEPKEPWQGAAVAAWTPPVVESIPVVAAAEISEPMEAVGGIEAIGVVEPVEAVQAVQAVEAIEAFEAIEVLEVIAPTEIVAPIAPIDIQVPELVVARSQGSTMTHSVAVIVARGAEN